MSMLIRELIDKFDYYKEPEGQDPIGKVVGFGQYGFYAGTFCAIYDACLYSHCLNAPQFLNTAGFWIVPMTGMCVAFSTVTYALTNIRKKDDKLNYICGALASGSVLHAWQKNVFRSGWGTFFFVLYAVVKKQNIQEGLGPHVFLPKDDPTSRIKWNVPWRNLEYRDYTNAPRKPHNKTDYYINHY